MNTKELKKILDKYNQASFRLKQLQKAVFKDGISAFSEISSLPKDLREILDKETKILSLEVEKVLVAKDGQSVKALLKLEDGKNIETVLISPKPDTWSVCISCQVGCPMNCRFCATGKMGLQRNLTSEEITDQVLFWKQYLRKSQISNSKNQINSKNKNPKIGNWDLEIGNYNIGNVVFMGMGEPFLNWENVRESLKDLINSDLFGFGSRSISVSTAGVPDGIEKLSEEFPQVNLAISLHLLTTEKEANLCR
jgi:23S rRNA (adenine2503-C2)-methyltransferase